MRIAINVGFVFFVAAVSTGGTSARQAEDLVYNGNMDGTSCSSMGEVMEDWTFFYDGDGVRIKETHTDFETSPTTITTRLFDIRV